MTDSTFTKLAMARSSRLACLVICGTLLSACTIGPDYKRPKLIEPAQFKGSRGWLQATPSDSIDRGAWWELYGDRRLNNLVTRLNNSNQTVVQAQARFRQAQAQVHSALGTFIPTVGLSAGKLRSSQVNTGLRSIGDTLKTGLSVSWEADLWGKLRRSLQANEANAEARYADLASMRLSQQSEMVLDYLQLRVMDEQTRLLQATLETYQCSLKIIENQYRAGVSGKGRFIHAQTQIKTTQFSLIDLIWQRSQLENAIAAFIGELPANFDLTVSKDIPLLPQIPVILPSQLLERRPDIASAERAVISANANIGVAEAAYYPDLTLGISGGYSSSTYVDWISLPKLFWSVGPNMSMTLFDGGQRSAEVDRTIATYDETVAKYRQTVLDGFREVENYMVQLRVLADEAVVSKESLETTRESMRLIHNQYEEGLISYLDVLTAQASTLSNELKALTLLQTQLVTSVNLITALGGGWYMNISMSGKD